MFRKISTILLFTCLSPLTIAQETGNWMCSYGDLMRRVEIFYEPGRAVPCEVHYYKDVEMPDERQVLWRAQNEAGYCEARAAEFIAKLERQGWDCGPADAMPEKPEEQELVDDTDALAPASDERPDGQ